MRNARRVARQRFLRNGEIIAGAEHRRDRRGPWRPQIYIIQCPYIFCCGRRAYSLHNESFAIHIWFPVLAIHFFGELNNP